MLSSVAVSFTWHAGKERTLWEHGFLFCDVTQREPGQRASDSFRGDNWDKERNTRRTRRKEEKGKEKNAASCCHHHRLSCSRRMQPGAELLQQRDRADAQRATAQEVRGQLAARDALGVGSLL